jgi:integrase
MLTESGGEPVGRVLTNEEQERLFKTAEAIPEWEHVYCAAILAANTSMRGVEVKNVRRKDFDAEKRVVHIRASKNETSKRVIPLNDSAFDAVQRIVRRADLLGHTEPTHKSSGAPASVTRWTRPSRRASGIQRGAPSAMQDLNAVQLKVALTAAERSRVPEYRKAADDAAKAFCRTEPSR